MDKRPGEVSVDSEGLAQGHVIIHLLNFLTDGILVTYKLRPPTFSYTAARKVGCGQRT